ncbi:SDR family oxidoreductase [Salinisphaera sp. T31B1]|uniref:SDR family oxidoreductase n=1 Tax=Salinisphaera sp. T31B1 TaxID=727963 RepID=UPI00333E3AA5
MSGLPVHNLIVGCGETGLRVAARAVGAGQSVTGIVRSADSARRVRSVGAVARTADLDKPLAGLPVCDRLFYFAPPPREGRADTRLQRVVDAMGPPPARVVYISTTGVYGDCDGAWVNEDRAVNPATDRAHRRVDAERRIHAWQPLATVLRAPGIYGPGRLPVERVRCGEPIVDDAEGGWSNRIHIDDLAEVAWQAGQRPWPHRIYNVTDGHPTRLGDYYDALAGLLGVPSPPRIPWTEAERQFSAMRLSFLRESRRLDTRRLLDDTGLELTFADFRDGLKASLRAEPRPA